MRRFLGALAVVWLLLFANLGCHALGVPRILIVNSYHPGLSWTDSITAGFRSAVLHAYPAAEFYVAYIDSKRISLTEARSQRIRTSLQVEYAHLDFDVVFLSDDDALKFWMRYGEEISPGTNVVFAGINGSYKYPSNYCGLLETVDLVYSLSLINTLSPDAERIFVVNDSTTTGRALTGQLLELRKENCVARKVSMVSGLSFDELAQKVSSIEPPNVIYLVLYNVDRKGAYLDYEKVMDIVAQRAKVPIYISWEFYLRRGAVGGNLISPGLHGREAGAMAVRLLRGASPASVGISSGPTRNMFDWKVMKAHLLNRSLLPKGTVMINSPYSIVLENRVLFVSIFFLIVLLLLAIVFFSLLSRVRRLRLKREKVLLEELRVSYQSVLDAKRKAEEASRLKSLFLANMSHEIRSPMNSIVGFANLLKDAESLSTEKRSKYVDVINTNSKALLSLISDILDISKIEANQLVICNGSCLLNQLMADLFVFFRNEQIRLGLGHLSLFYNQGSPDANFTIYTDKDRLRQVLVNLISNSLKYTSEGQVEWGYTLDDSNVQFYVRDTGAGIAPELLPRIFEHFIQEDKPLGDKKGGGVGLGLAISKALVELLGGEIWLESKLNVGTTVFFTLPLIPTVEPNLAAAQTATSSE